MARDDGAAKHHATARSLDRWLVSVDMNAKATFLHPSKRSWMKQSDCSLLAEGFERLLLDVQVRNLNKTFRLGLLEHRIPPMLFATVYPFAKPEKLGHRIVKIQRCVHAAIALKPSDEMLEMRWSSSGAVCRRWLVRGYE